MPTSSDEDLSELPRSNRARVVGDFSSGSILISGVEANVESDIRGPGSPSRPISSFIGREGLLASVALLLDHTRLLTLTGPGGSGKTRISVELARRVKGDYPGGVHFVPLAAIWDPALVPSAIARQLGLQDSRDRPLLEHLASYLRDRTVLLVLDNFEHLVSSADQVAELLATGSGTRIVVTSRSPLRLTGEQEFPVPPLAVPDPATTASPEVLAQCESTMLFLTRAKAVAPDFTVTDKDAPVIANIVRRVDGLPLAIELAAARVKLLPPSSILARLDQSLELLVGGNRDLPDRQQTLRSTIAWSHDLLTEGARRLLAVRAVFRGGAPLEGLESVCAASLDLGVPVLDAVQELLDQSLLRLSSSADQPRYEMLETVREFAAERLAERPEAAAVHEAHARVFAALAERIERPPIWPDNEFLALVDLDHDNLRAALDWLQDHDPSRALRMAAKLTAYWSIRGHFTEGRRRLHALLDLVGAETPERVAALNGAGWLALDQGDLQTSLSLLDESVGLARSISDRIGEGTALLNRGRTGLGSLGIAEGGRDVADALAVLTATGDDKGVAAALMFSGLVPQFSGDLETGCVRFAQCIARCEQLGLITLRARALQLLGLARIEAGDVHDGRGALAEAVPVVLESGDRFGIAVGLVGLIALAANSGRPRLALRLVGVLEEYAHINQVTPPQPLLALIDTFLAPIRAVVGPSAETLRAEGRGWGLDEAVAAALSDEPEQPWRNGPGPGLTRREAEVAELVAVGLTNREIAARLFLSVRTVDVHVDHILTKLQFTRRGQLTAWAHDNGLVAGRYVPTR
jgi:predicted ATPase/DNA-binding CsgD family transcriptional regulator